MDLKALESLLDLKYSHGISQYSYIQHVTTMHYICTIDSNIYIYISVLATHS